MLATARTARATTTELRGIALVALAGGVGGRVSGGLLAEDVGLGARLVGDELVDDGETDVETDVGTDVALVEDVVTDVVAGVTDVSAAGVGELPGVAATGAVSAAKRVAVPSAARAGHSPTTTSTAAAHSTAATRGRCTRVEPRGRLGWPRIPQVVPSVTRLLVMAETTGCSLGERSRREEGRGSTMSTSGAPRPAGGYGTVIDSRRLWAGGAATACVAALVALIGVLLFNSVLDVKLVQHPLLLTLTGSLAVNYAVTAFVAALVATGIAHLLTATTPRPRLFFGWIVGLATVAAMVVPFAAEASTASKVSTAVINMVVGIAIGSLLTGVLSRTVIRTGR
jgi:hypothetical protein